MPATSLFVGRVWRLRTKSNLALLVNSTTILVNSNGVYDNGREAVVYTAQLATLSAGTYIVIAWQGSTPRSRGVQGVLVAQAVGNAPHFASRASC